jgi:TolB-like protein
MDVDEWANAYGMDATKIRQIQDDVRNAVVTAIYAMEISPNAVDVR